MTPPRCSAARLIGKPPDVLITTPESLFLMLTSAARETLTLQTVIVDEVHAVAGTKRGAHLALSLERLDALWRTRAADRTVGHGAAARGGGPLLSERLREPRSSRR